MATVLLNDGHISKLNWICVESLHRKPSTSLRKALKITIVEKYIMICTSQTPPLISCSYVWRAIDFTSDYTCKI